MENQVKVRNFNCPHNNNTFYIKSSNTFLLISIMVNFGASKNFFRKK